MKTPLVSVIIPVYNQEKWIGRCLRALLNQTMNRDEYELVVIDDGSEDRTDYALELFKDDIELKTIDITNTRKYKPVIYNILLKYNSSDDENIFLILEFIIFTFSIIYVYS